MCSVPTEVPAAARAQWLAQLADALNDAHQLILALELAGDQRIVSGELYLRIEAARFEVQSLRLSRSLNPRTQADPKWTGCPPWNSSCGSDG